MINETGLPNEILHNLKWLSNIMAIKSWRISRTCSKHCRIVNVYTN